MEKKTSSHSLFRVLTTFGVLFLLLSLIIGAVVRGEEEEELVYVDDVEEEANRPTTNKDVHEIWKIGAVERLSWSPDKPFAKEIALHRNTPVVLLNTNASTSWKPIHWTYSYLLSALGKDKLIRVSKSRDPTFYLYREFEEFGLWPNTAARYQETDVYLGELIQKLQSSRTPTEWLYAPVKITQSNHPKLYEDIQPTQFLNVKPVLTHQHATLWMGTRGVTTQIHFDLDENFHLQITGNKRFLLVPPSEHNKLYTYPRTHPSYRRSMVRFDSVDEAKFPSISTVKGAIEVTLKPGELLYIPPLWFHHVTNTNAGLSINVFSDSDEITFWDEVQRTRPTFQPLPTLQLRVALGKMVLNKLLKLAKTSVSFKSHFNQHYANLVLELERDGRKPLSEKDILEIRDGCHNKVYSSQIGEAGVQQIVDTALAKLTSVPDKVVLELVLTDYIDRVAFAAVNKVHDLLPIFFQ